MAAGGESEVLIWVKPDPFFFSILPLISPHLKLSPKYLKYIIPYSQTKSSLGYPKLSYTVWRHIACNKLVLPEDLAWVLFLTYRTLQRGRSESRIQWDYHFATRSQDRDYLKSLTTVDTLKFTLMLFLQNYIKINLRSSSLLSVSTEEWPSLNKTLRNGKPNGMRNATRRTLKIFDEEHHLKFVEKKLVEMIELLKTKENLNCGNWVPLEVIEALSFIIEGSFDSLRSVTPLQNILLSPNLRVQLGFSSSRKAFLADKTIDWILTHLKIYPYSLSKTPTLERKMFLGVDVEAYENGKIILNTPIPKGHKRAVMMRLNKQTIAKSSDKFRGAKLHIHRCSHCYIYVLIPLRSVVITKCHDTTIVLGPVANTINVVTGKNLRIISPCRRITVSNCIGSEFFLLTPSQPVLSGNRNDRLILAPYNTTYPKLDEHLSDSGLGQALNLWDSPIHIAEEGSFEFQQFPPKQCWELMSPHEFYMFNIPFHMDSETKVVSVDLPEMYKLAQKQQQQQIDEWQRIVDSANLNQRQRNQLNKLIKDRFNRWLILKGYQQELDGLNAYDVAMKNEV
ncbi:TBCC domain-containing protein 1 [Chamberlinius hualienensis]